MSLRKMWLLSKLRSADTVTKEALAKDARTPSAVLAELGRDSAASVRLAIASHPNLPQSTLYELGHDPEKSVRTAALTHLLQLAGLGSSADAMRRPNACTPQLLAVIAEDLHVSSTELGTLCGTGYYLGDPPTPRAEVLAELAKTRNPGVRALVAKSRFATPSLLELLVSDSDEAVRVAVADNMSTQLGALSVLQRDSSSAVRRRVATRADMPVASLIELVADNAPDVRRAAALNANTPDRELTKLASDPDIDVRLAVAQRPCGGDSLDFLESGEPGPGTAPTEALRLLAGDNKSQVRMAAASNPRLPLDAFTALADDPVTTVRKHVAAVIEHGYLNVTPGRLPRRGAEKDGPLVPTDALSRLADAGHLEIRRAVARHPQVPATLLARLLDDKQLFDWDELVPDSLWDDRTVSPHRVLYERSWENGEEWQTIAGVENPGARAVLARHPATPVEILNQLVDDPADRVRLTLLQSPKLSPELLRRLMDDPSTAIASQAAELLENNPCCYEQDLRLFMDAPFPAVRTILARSEGAMPEWLEQLAGDDAHQVRAAVAGNPNTPPPALATLAADNHDSVIDAIVTLIEKDALPAITLETLATTENPRIRAAVAVNGNVTDTSLKGLVSDADESVRQAAAASGFRLGAALIMAIGGGEMARQFGVGREKVATLIDIAKDTNIGADALHSLAQSPFTEVRVTVAAHTATSSATLANLCRDKDPAVRTAVAMSTNASQEVLTILARDETTEVRRGVAANPNSLAVILAQLDRDTDEGVALAVAIHRNVTSASLDAVIQTHGEPKSGDLGARLLQEFLLRSDRRWRQGARQAVASNPLTSVETLVKLSQQPDTAGYVASNPNTPTETLAELANSHATLIREAVAKNPNTPSAALALLALDTHERVRLMVASNQRAAEGTLEILASDFSASVQAAARQAISTRE